MHGPMNVKSKHFLHHSYVDFTIKEKYTVSVLLSCFFGEI